MAKIGRCRVLGPREVNYARGYEAGSGRRMLSRQNQPFWRLKSGNLENIPGEANGLSRTQDPCAESYRAGDNKCYAAHLEAKEPGPGVDGSIRRAIPQLLLIRAVKNFETGQLDMRTTWLNGLCTFADPVPMEPPPGDSHKDIPHLLVNLVEVLCNFGLVFSIFQNSLPR